MYMINLNPNIMHKTESQYFDQTSFCDVTSNNTYNGRKFGANMKGEFRGRHPREVSTHIHGSTIMYMSAHTPGTMATLQ